ncbi:MAG: twin-arginine translocase subunit TatC [Nitrospiria bacterium]
MAEQSGSKDTADMPMSGHLQEIRSRLIQSLLILLITSGAAFYFSETLVFWIKRPIDADLVFLSPGEAFWADLKIALFFGFLIAFPFILYQLWLFVAPGLLQNERRVLWPFFGFGAFFFFCGVAFSYFVALPFAIRFLVNYGRESGITPMLSVSNYIDFNLKILLAFGIVFELPLVMVLLSKLGLLTPGFLIKNRKFAVLGAFVVAAIATPTPDIFNQLLMAIPLILLYEIGIVTIRLFGGKGKNVEAEASGRMP